MNRYIDADKVMQEIERIGGHNLCGLGLRLPQRAENTPSLLKGAKMENRELRECPFCGGKAVRKQLTNFCGQIMYYIDCSNKKCLISPATSAYKSKGADARAWNRRANDGT